MTADEIETAGRLLFGNAWKFGFCERFQINPRTLRHMLAGQDVPVGLRAEIETALRGRKQDLEQFLGTAA